MKAFLTLAALFSLTASIAAQAEYQYIVLLDDVLTSSATVSVDSQTSVLGLNAQHTRAYSLDCVRPYQGNQQGALVLVSYVVQGNNLLPGSKKLVAVEQQVGEACTPSYKRMSKPGTAGATYRLKAVSSLLEKKSGSDVGNFIFFEKN